jgi:hypothetical protein
LNTQSVTPKNKTAAVLLAVFLSFWTWLYTYRREGWKFWVSLALTSASMLVMALATFFIMTSYNNIPLPTDPFTAWLLAWIIAYTIAIGLWVWAIVDTSVKNNDWFNNYPN